MIISLHIQKLYEGVDINVDFFNDVSILVGDNGSFKTTILDIINLINTRQLEMLTEYKMETLVLKYISKNATCTFSMKKNNSDMISDSYYTTRLAVQLNDTQITTFTGKVPVIEEQNVHEDSNEYSETTMRETSIRDTLSNQTSNNYEYKKVIIGLRQYPLRILYMPSNRLGDQLITFRLNYITSLVIKRVNAISKIKEVFMDNFKSKVLNEVFNLHLNDSEQLLSAKTIAAFNTLTKTASDYNIDQINLEKNISSILELNEDSLIFIENKGKERDKKTKEYKSYINFLKASSQFALINEITPLILEWNTMHEKLFAPLQSLLDALHNFFSYTNDIRFDINDTGLIYQRHIGNTWKSIPLRKLSSGEIQLITMLTYSFLDDFDTFDTIIIDEPELSMHSEWQLNFLSSLQNVDQNYQIICSTHSSFIADNHIEKMINDYMEVSHASE